MSATKSNLYKISNIRKEKHHKGKRKIFKPNILQFDPYFTPYVTSKRVKALYKYNDINSFWKYSPVNPFSLRKYEEESDDDIPRCVTNGTASAPSEKKRRASPKLNTVASAENMSSLLSRRENDNSAAVIEARREIEKIKSELETLINSNIKAQVTHTESTNLIPPELPEIETLLDTAADACNTLADKPDVIEIEPEPSRSNAPEPVIKTTVLFHSPTRRKVVPLSIEEPPPPLFEQIRPKSRSYDPEKTREFIKKQKLRRKEKLLEEEQEKQQKEFARKMKLEELKKKTIELVSKNLKKTTVKSAKTPSDFNTNNTTKSIDNNKTVNKFLLQSRRCRARSFDNSKCDKETETKRSRSVSREISINQSNQKIPENQMLVGAKSQVSLRSSSQKSLSPKTTIKSLEKKEPTKLDTPSKMIEINEINEKTSLSTKENIKKESPPLNTKQKILSVNITSNNEILPSVTTKRNEEINETNAAKELTEIKQKLETSITQIKDKNEIPIWLQPPSSVPYPYNFISAVRKKLEYVTRKPNKIDKNDENNKLNVSVQCTLDKKKLDISKDKKILDVNSVNIPKLKSPVKLESPKNRTYESHKCRRQLYPNMNIPQKNSIELKTNEIEININKSDSDSDTTKNIPELPHEETAQPVKHTTKFEENKKNITFDKSKDNFSRESSKFSLASDISERVKNITFERNIPPKLNMGDIKLPEPEKYPALVPPEDKIEIPKPRKTRSKYPEDIESILSHYSKIKSEQNSYSDDFNSASSKPEKTSKTESITEYKQIPSGFVSLSKSGTISEHLARTNSNSSSKENIFEENSKKTNSKSRVSTETNLTMKDVPSLSSKQTDSVAEATTIKTESDLIKTDPSTIRTASSIHLEHKEKEEKSVNVPPLKKLTKPEVFLKRRAEEIENNPNHIHLKLQAEVHLLNSFNNSLKQVVAVEKSVFDVPSTSNFNPINCKRGCDYSENEVFNKSDSKFTKNTSFKSFKNNNNNNNSAVGVNDDDDESVCSKDLGMSNIIDRSSISTTVATNSIISRREENLDLKGHPYVAISLDMVDQMIKDEDIRLEHLKAVLKLRDQALFDRIKGELALLEIRKRELREHGQTNDITAIKKKQRGLIIKLQQERHEMHRLKTAHKQAAKARKSALHEQKSIIKTQLSSTDQIPKKLRRLSHLERPSLGPVKVYRVDSRTEVSETTLSRKGSDESVTNSSVLTQISEKISVEKSEIFYSDSLAVVESLQKNKQSSLQSEKLKRSLLMKEAEIDKRRKEIEELIKWQKRLKQKEAEVVELERQAVKSLQSDKQGNVRVFTGAHLNKVWKGIALPDKNFDDHKKYQMSKRSLDKFYQNARKMFREVSDEERRSKTESYSSEFEPSNCTSRLDLSNSVASLNDVDVNVARLQHISDIISVPDDVDKSVSASESPSVKTEVNTLIKSDSIHSESPDSLQNKSPPTKSLELIIASEYSNRKPDESTSIASEILKTDSLEKSPSEHLIVTEKSDILSPDSRIQEKLHSTSIQTDNIPEVSQPQISENIDSLNSSAKSDYISEASEKCQHQFEENIISGNSSAKSNSDVKTIPEVSEKYEPHVLENIPSKDSSVKSDSNIGSIHEATDKSERSTEENIVSEDTNISKSVLQASENQIEENIVSGNSSAYTHSDVRTIPEASGKSDARIQENTDSRNSSAKSEINTFEHKSISELEQPSEKSELQIPDSINSSIKSESVPDAADKSELPIQENIESLNSSAKSETNTFEYKSSPELEEVSEKSKHQIVENIDSHNSSIKSESGTTQVQENIVSETSSVKSENDGYVSESPEKSTTPAQESNRIESWEPQIISDIKSESSEKEIETSEIKSGVEANSVYPEKSSNTQSIVESKIFDEPESKSKTNSDTHVSEQNFEIDVATPRSEVQYETDFDKFSESDQSKIETESNVSLKETNVDSSINEDEPEEIEKSDVSESSNKVTAESVSDTIKVSPKDAESKNISEKSESEETAPEILDEDALNDSKKGVSHIDVRKRVSEILADANANGPRGDKSPRVQDLYTTTYDIAGSSETTPESGSPTNEFSKQEKTPCFSPETPYINEAEELLRKQLEIEQEIKRLERQQQNIPYLFMREIPNKPPPPYKPPDFPLAPVIASIIPSKPEQTKRMINDAADVLYSAYASGDLTKTSSDAKEDQQRFMFDLCKEIAIEACKPTIETKQPSWRSHKNKFQNVFARRPITKDRLHSVLNKKVLQLLNFEPVARNDSLIIRWSRKKRDHVDEILVSETQAEEAEWTNFDSDEEVIKDNLTQNILDLLIVEAAKDFNDILNKKKVMRCSQDC